MSFDPQVNAPYGAQYSPPLLNFGALAELPNDIFQAQQRARTQAMQNAFPGGVPLDANGQPDINKIVNTGAKLGGLEYVQGLLPYMYGANIGAAASQGLAGAVPPAGAPASGAAGSPAAMRAQPQATAQPTTSQQAPPAEIAMQGNGTRDNPYLPTSRVQYEEIPDGTYYRASSSTAVILKGQEGQRYGSTSPANRTDAAVAQPTAEETSSQDRSNNGPNARPTQVAGTGAPFMAGGINTPAGGSTSGAPAPASTVAGAPGPIATPPQRQAQAAPQTTALPNAAAGIVPPGYDPNAFAQALTRRAAELRAQGSRFASLPNGMGAPQAKIYQDQAQALEDRAKQIFEVIGKAAQPTPEQQNAAASGAASPIEYERNKELQKGAITRSDKTYSGLQAQAAQYERDLKPYLDISRSVLNDPSMYTGTGANIALNVNRIRAAFGNNAPAMLQEALQKVTASSVLGQINTQRDQLMEAGGASSRIFAQQVELVEKAAPALSNTPGGNRFLVEVSTRMGELSRAVRDMAIEYTSDPRHPYLDKAFDAKVAEYMDKHPVFTKQEMSHPELLGAPTMPPALKSKQEIGQWARDMGLHTSDAIRAPDGRYVPAEFFIKNAAH